MFSSWEKTTHLKAQKYYSFKTTDESEAYVSHFTSVDIFKTWDYLDLETAWCTEQNCFCLCCCHGCQWACDVTVVVRVTQNTVPWETVKAWRGCANSHRGEKSALALQWARWDSGPAAAVKHPQWFGPSGQGPLVLHLVSLTAGSPGGCRRHVCCRKVWQIILWTGAWPLMICKREDLD